MKIVVISIVVGLALAAVMFMAGVWTQSVRDSDTKNTGLQTAIANEVSDIKAKLEKMDAKLDLLVRIATAPANADLDCRR